jgi:hypothetical protein
MNKTSIEETIAYIETFIKQGELSGKELLIIAIAFQNGLLRGLKEAEFEKEKENDI